LRFLAVAVEFSGYLEAEGSQEFAAVDHVWFVLMSVVVEEQILRLKRQIVLVGR
jgi:hypothetical protein